MQPHRRREDGHALLRLATGLGRWQAPLTVVTTLGMLAGLAWATLGFGFPHTPRSQFVELATSIDSARRVSHQRDSLIELRVDTIAQQHTRMLAVMRILAVDACLRLSAAEARRAQLPCTDVLTPPALDERRR